MISVIVPTYNCAQYLAEAIDSVLNQTYQDYECVVVDDGSTDNTTEVLKKFEGRIKYIYQENAGLPAARNTGIRNSRGEYLAFLDADDIWMEGKLALQVKIMDSYPDVGLIFSDLLVFNDKGVIADSAFAFYGGMRFIKQIPAISIGDNSFIFQRSIFQELMQLNFIGPPAVMLRRSCLEKVGLFNEKIKSAEDKELWLRFTREHKIGYSNLALVKRRLHETNLTSDSQLRYESMLRICTQWLNALELLTQEEIDLVKKMRSKAYFQLGRALFKKGVDLKNARKYLFKSLKYYFRTKAIIYILLSFLGGKTIAFAIHAYHRKEIENY